MNTFLLVLATLAVMIGGVAAAESCCPYPGVSGAFQIANISRDLFKCSEDLKLVCVLTSLPEKLMNIGIAYNVTAPGPVDKSHLLGEMLTGMSMNIFCDQSQGLWRMEYGINRYENFICTQRVAGAQVVNGY